MKKESKELKIALVGQWHVHGFDFAKRLNGMEGCSVSAAADCPEQWAEELGCRLYPGIREVFADPSIDGVIVASSIAEHRDVLIGAAESGKDIFVEKALAVSEKDAEDIVAAVRKSGVHFAISDPVMKAPQMFARNLMDSGTLGKIFGVHVRQCHDQGYQGTLYRGFYHPDESGGGTMNDLGFKGTHILWNLLGKPESVFCSLKYVTGLSDRMHAEESATAVYSYKDGAIGTVECSWLTPKFESGLDIYGTEGCLCIRDGLVTCRFRDGSWKSVPSEELPDPKPYPLTYWIENIRYDRPDEFYGIEEALEVTRMIMAAYRASDRNIRLQ